MTNQGQAEPQTGSSRPHAISISVFFPCYNEEDNVGTTVAKAREVLDRLNADYELIIVDDGSSDDTARIADTIATEDPAVKVIHHPTNLGYGVALQSGIRAAHKNLVFYTDGDGQFDFAEMPPLLDLMRHYDIVSCYRLDRQDSIVRRFNGWCWTKLVCLMFGLKIRDIDCAFKLYKREVFDNMELCSTGALIAAEILTRAVRKGCTITQTGVHHFPRTAGRQTGADLRVILRAFRELIKLRKKISSAK
ncbi:MAG: glycosyltransferase family 2 protein [Sedimentisphaerales bacterium]|nr:glycosyltransferase family 2 protein [Sedimentisphaerales bacterium]